LISRRRQTDLSLPRDAKPAKTEIRTVSVIIPTYNRVASLQETIKSFLQQDYPPDKFEVIVADNNADSAAAEAVHEMIRQSEIEIRYLSEKRPGVHFARNSAAKIAQGHILYYTDDDMLADPSLLSELVKVFDFDPKVAVATGRVLPQWEVEPPRWVTKLCNNHLLSLNDPREEFIISPDDCRVFSCHQAILKEAFFEAGGFNPENTQGAWLGDGETGLNIKIKDRGYRFGYTGKSVTHHVIPRERMTQRYLNNRLANQGNCDSYTAYRRHRYSKFGLAGQAGFSLAAGFMSACLSLFYLLAGNTRWRIFYAHLFYNLSKVKYNWRIGTDANWRAYVLKTDWLE